MITRRAALVSTLGIPLVRIARPKPAIDIISDNTCLSAESAAGYRLGRDVPLERSVLVVAAVREFSATLGRVHRALADGAFVVIESDPFAARGRQLTPARYIHYTWPVPAMIRSFGPLRAMTSDWGECIAHCSGFPVVARRGNVLFLGAMLGPHLFAGDREALELWNALLVRCAGRSSDGTSTTA